MIQMKAKLIYFLFGYIISLAVMITIHSMHPKPQGDIACGQCGAYKWYFQLATNDEEDNNDTMD